MDVVDTNTPGWFELRTAATKIIISNMTEAEKEELRKKGEEMAENGLPENVKRRYVCCIIIMNVPTWCIQHTTNNKLDSQRINGTHVLRKPLKRVTTKWAFYLSL